MSTGQQLNLLELQLARLQQRVRQVQLDALGKGESPGAGTPGDPSLAARLHRLGHEFRPILRDLDRISRQLLQIGDWLDLRDRIALRLGRDQRYSARQSVRDLRARGRAIYQMLDDIRADIEQIVQAAGFPTERERIELINDAIEKVAEFAGHRHEVQALTAQPAGPVVIPSHVTVNVSLPGLLLTAYVLALWLARKAGGRDQSAIDA
jgi:hypothetical protein